MTLPNTLFFTKAMILDATHLDLDLEVARALRNEREEMVWDAWVERRYTYLTWYEEDMVDKFPAHAMLIETQGFDCKIMIWVY